MGRFRLNQAFDQRVPSFADTTALGTAANKGANDQVALVVDPPGLWRYDAASTATAGPGVVGSGTGRWLQVTGAAASGSKNLTALNATTTTLAAYTRTGNVILADGNGAIGDIDGVTNVVGDKILLKNGAAGEDNGLFVLDIVGDGSNAYQLTRAEGYDSSDEVSDGDRVQVQQGTANGDKTWRLTTNEVITLNTTGLTFRLESDPVDLASVATGLGASLIGIEDAGTFTAATEVEAALAEIYQHIASTQAHLPIPLNEFLDTTTAAGTPLTLFVGAGVLPGFDIVDTEALGIRWNNDATPDTIQASIPLPPDFNDAADFTIHYMVSKTGATVGDAVTFTSSIVFQTSGALHDADTPVVDTSTALTGDDAAKTVTELITTFGNADIPAGAKIMNITINPTDGLLGTDDCHLLGIWVEYTRAILTA